MTFGTFIIVHLRIFLCTSHFLPEQEQHSGNCVCLFLWKWSADRHWKDWETTNCSLVFREPRHAGKPGSILSILLAQVWAADPRWYSKAFRKTLSSQTAAMTRLPTGSDPWLVLIPESYLGSVLESCRQPEPKLCRNCEQFKNQDCSRTVLRSLFWYSGLLVEMTVLSHLSYMSPFVLGRCHFGSAWIHTKHLLIMLACALHTWRSIKTNPVAPQLHRVDTWDQKKMLAL